VIDDWIASHSLVEVRACWYECDEDSAREGYMLLHFVLGFLSWASKRVGQSSVDPFLLYGGED
jgi:hypothetical protein